MGTWKESGGCERETSKLRQRTVELVVGQRGEQGDVTGKEVKTHKPYNSRKITFQRRMRRRSSSRASHNTFIHSKHLVEQTLFMASLGVSASARRRVENIKIIFSIKGYSPVNTYRRGFRQVWCVQTFWKLLLFFFCIEVRQEALVGKCQFCKLMNNFTLKPNIYRCVAQDGDSNVFCSVL